MDTNTEAFRFLRLPEVKRVTGLSRTQIYRLEAAGQFCKRVKLGPSPMSATAWISTDVERWMDERVAASRLVAA